MFGYFVLTANMAYGAWQCAGMWKRGKPRESVVIGMLSLIVAAYFIPPISDYCRRWNLSMHGFTVRCRII